MKPAVKYILIVVFLLFLAFMFRLGYQLGVKSRMWEDFIKKPGISACTTNPASYYTPVVFADDGFIMSKTKKWGSGFVLLL